VPNFGPGTGPDVLRRRALMVEGLGFDLLMVSDHIAVTPDVAEQYPAPFYEPFTTLAWLAGLTRRIRVGTTVLIQRRPGRDGPPGGGVAGPRDGGRALQRVDSRLRS
jgi:alkanesulfonate monooxygenase SsuD/methylene tetrahydromethanopterin reductase-like flavin-dependent oxidoreductase (luciferase family)